MARHCLPRPGTPRVPRRALRDVVSWAHANQPRFCNRLIEQVTQPPNGWVGRWDSGERLGVHRLLVRRSLAKSWSHAGYEREAILFEWRERGWLIVGTDGSRYTTRARSLDGAKTSMIIIKREAVDEVEA